LDFLVYRELIDNRVDDRVFSYIYDSLIVAKLYYVNFQFKHKANYLTEKEKDMLFKHKHNENDLLMAGDIDFLKGDFNKFEALNYVDKLFDYLEFNTDFKYGYCFLSWFKPQKRILVMKRLNFLPMVYEPFIGKTFSRDVDFYQPLLERTNVYRVTAVGQPHHYTLVRPERHSVYFVAVKPINEFKTFVERYGS